MFVLIAKQNDKGFKKSFYTYGTKNKSKKNT